MSGYIRLYQNIYIYIHVYIYIYIYISGDQDIYAPGCFDLFKSTGRPGNIDLIKSMVCPGRFGLVLIYKRPWEF